MEKNLLSICPSRLRPQILQRMLTSYQLHKSSGSDIVVYISDDDPKLNEYKEVLQTTTYIIGKRKFIVEICNEIVMKNINQYKYFQIINDDHVIKTPQFDLKLIKVIEDNGGWGIACPNDEFTPWEIYPHPSAEIISGNIIQTLGYYIYPKIQHVGIDNFIGKIGTRINRLFHVMDVVIEHRHWFAGKAFLDANYKFVYSNEQFNFGMAMVREYVDTQLDADIAKLKKEMEKC